MIKSLEMDLVVQDDVISSEKSFKRVRFQEGMDEDESGPRHSSNESFEGENQEESRQIPSESPRKESEYQEISHESPKSNHSSPPPHPHRLPSISDSRKTLRLTTTPKTFQELKSWDFPAQQEYSMDQPPVESSPRPSPTSSSPKPLQLSTPPTKKKRKSIEKIPMWQPESAKRRQLVQSTTPPKKSRRLSLKPPKSTRIPLKDGISIWDIVRGLPVDSQIKQRLGTTNSRWIRTKQLLTIDPSQTDLSIQNRHNILHFVVYKFLKEADLELGNGVGTSVKPGRGHTTMIPKKWMEAIKLRIVEWIERELDEEEKHGIHENIST